MKSVKNIVCYIVLLSFLLLSTIGCHTVEGMGKDIEEGGEAIQEAAD